MTTWFPVKQSKLNSAVNRISERIAKRNAARPKTAEDNRKLYPDIARFVDLCRKHFGSSVRVVKLEKK